MRLARSIASAVLIAAALTKAAAVRGQNTCADPATPLRTLAARYDRWPALPPGRRPVEAKEKAMTYFRSGDGTDYHRALLAYENLQRDFPNDLHVKLALGVLYLSGPDINYKYSDGYRHVAVLQYSNADARGARLMRNAIERDSSQWIAAIGLTRIALVSLDKGRIDEAYALIERALKADPFSTPLHLAWRDLLVREGHFQQALNHSRVHDGECAGQKHALAEAMMIAGDTAAGSRLYIETLDRAGPSDIDRFYDDMRPMLTVGQLRTYKAVPVSERPSWIRALWRRTAAASGRTLETRVTEQTIRATYADMNFRAKMYKKELVVTDTTQIVPWDAAGVYYVRHGPPDVGYNAREGGMEFAGWVYKGHNPPVTLLMSRRASPPSDWAPLYDPVCPPLSSLHPMDLEAARERIATGNNMWLRDIYLVFAQTDPRYADVISECRFVVLGIRRIKYENLVVQYRYDNRKILPHFSKPVRMAVEAYQFRSPSGDPEVVVMPAIPVADLRDATSTAQQLRIMYSLTDSIVAAFSSDTMVALPAGATTGLVRVPLTLRSPGITNGQLRVTVTDPADTLRGATRSVPLAIRTDKNKLALSDIVIADTDAPGPLVRGIYRLSPVPDHRVRTDDAFRVFFELYGVNERDEIETAVRIRRTDPKSISEQLRLRGKRQERIITMKGNAELDARGVAVRDVEVAGDLVPGRYSIDITITTAGGTTITRSGTLVVE